MPKKQQQKDLTILVPAPPKELEEQLKQEEARFKDLDPRLPRPPFNMVAQAPVCSGKSVVIVNLIANPNFYKETFENIVIFSPSISNDKTWSAILMADDSKFTKPEIINDPKLLDNLDFLLEQIYNRCVRDVEAARKDNKRVPYTLIILDDCLPYLKSKNKAYKKICTSFRHPRISVITSTQKFRALPNETRCNAMHYLIWETNNQDELRKIEEEFAGIFGNQNFKQAYNEATRQQYHFLYVNIKDKRLMHNFEDTLYDRYESDK